MEIRLENNIPRSYGEHIEQYTEIFDENEDYIGYTLSDDLNIIKSELCSWENDGEYNRHTGEPDETNHLMVNGKQRWWTPSKAEIKKLQLECLESHKQQFSAYLEVVEMKIRENKEQ